MSDADDPNEKVKSGLAYGAGLSLFLAVAGFCGLGWVLDHYFQTAPWLMVGGVVVGAIAGFYQFIRITSRL